MKDMNNKIQHIAFIMDGNSSWSKLNNRPIMEGYLKGMRNISRIVFAAQKYGVKYVTFYAFSSENCFLKVPS